VISKLTGLEGHWDNIQNDNLDSPLGQELNNLPTDAASTTSDQNHLLIPPVLVGSPVIQRLAVQVAIDPADDAERKQNLNPLECLLVEDGEVAALLGVASEEDEWEGESWVEEG
jgi:hypothetical protein